MTTGTNLLRCLHERTHQQSLYEFCAACGRTWWPNRARAEAGEAEQLAKQTAFGRAFSDDARREAFMAGHDWALTSKTDAEDAYDAYLASRAQPKDTK